MCLPVKIIGKNLGKMVNLKDFFTDKINSRCIHNNERKRKALAKHMEVTENGN